MKHKKENASTVKDNKEKYDSEKFRRLVSLSLATDEFINEYVGNHIFATCNMTVYDHRALAEARLNASSGDLELNVAYDSGIEDDLTGFDESGRISVMYKTEASAYFFLGTLNSAKSMEALIESVQKKNLSIIVGDLC
jgi:hypothetical protein